MALASVIEWLTELSREWALIIQNWFRSWTNRALKPTATSDAEMPVVAEAEMAEIVEDASFCQIYNEKNDADETPIVDLDKKFSNTSSDLSDIVYKNLGKTITKSFEVDDVLKSATDNKDDNIVDNAYSSDFETDDENEKESQPKQIKDIRQDILSEYRGAFFDYDEQITYKREIKINFESTVVQSVELEGSFNDWKEPVDLQQNFSAVIDNEWGAEIETPLKEFHFRFVVDGSRMLSSTYPRVDTAEQGLLNLYQI